jgi:hypothetical protein
LVEKKKRGGLAGLLEVESANHYTMDPSWWIHIFLSVIR